MFDMSEKKPYTESVNIKARLSVKSSNAVVQMAIKAVQNTKGQDVMEGK